MDYEMIENKVKDFCKAILDDTKVLSELKDKIIMRGIAYGAVMFACNNLFPTYNRDLANWWWHDFADEFTKGE